jgi:hypothetical protein
VGCRRGAIRRKIRRVAPYRIVLLATVCVLIMLCAGVVQLLGVSQMA